MDKPLSVDDYIAAFPEDVQKILTKFRQVIKKAAPQAEEVINYGIPTLKLHGNLVHFGGYKNHLGFYPAPSGIKNFSEALKPYATAKGSIRFLYSERIPYALITEIVQFRIKENRAKATSKKK